MTNNTSAIILDGPIDFLIFSKSKISLELNDVKKTRFEATITDRQKDTIIIALPLTQDTADLRQMSENQTMKLTASYKSKMLMFQCSIGKLDDNNHLSLIIPFQGELADRRNCVREEIKFDTGSFHVLLKVESILELKSLVPVY